MSATLELSLRLARRAREPGEDVLVYVAGGVRPFKANSAFILLQPNGDEMSINASQTTWPNTVRVYIPGRGWEYGVVQ